MSPEWCKLNVALLNVLDVEIGILKNHNWQWCLLWTRQVRRPLIHISTTTSVGTDLYPHMPTYVHTPCDIPRIVHRLRDIYSWFSHPKLYFPVAGRFVQFWASGGAKFPKMGDSLPRMPEKFVTVQTHKQTNKQ